ncbi:MAG: ribosome recycling factor [Verrucomicrobiota bacterium]
MTVDNLLPETTASMQKAVEHLSQEFASVRTGRASPALVEGIDIHVTIYGSSMKLKQLAQISTPEARLITVTPFDPSTLQDVERGLRESKLGINPSVDGKLIRLPIPEPTEERRKELVKLVKDQAEQARVGVRAARKDGMDGVKSLKSSGDITEDDVKDFEKEIQEVTDQHVGEIAEMVKNKEDEIMTV